jgi:hypothetical protein
MSLWYGGLGAMVKAILKIHNEMTGIATNFREIHTNIQTIQISLGFSEICTDPSIHFRRNYCQSIEHAHHCAFGHGERELCAHHCTNSMSINKGNKLTVLFHSLANVLSRRRMSEFAVRTPTTTPIDIVWTIMSSNTVIAPRTFARPLPQITRGLFTVKSHRRNLIICQFMGMRVLAGFFIASVQVQIKAVAGRRLKFLER